MVGVSAVVHMAAMIGVWRPTAEYRAVNVAGTRNVCRAALAAGVARVVHVSSLIVYGMGLGETVNEASPLRRSGSRTR
jgi:2-alkyl-3-oxoalkanoate reductase